MPSGLFTAPAGLRNAFPSNMESIKRLPSWAFPAAASALFLGYLVFMVAVFASGYESARQGGAPTFTDFTSKYAVSMLVQRGPVADLYVPERMVQAGVAAAQAAYDGILNDRQAHGVGFAPWMYPPFFIFFIYPLALLPYLASLAAWLAVTAIPYILAMTRVLRGRGGLFLAISSPATFYNMMFGQTGFLSGGLIGLGLSQIYARPVLAGICIGLASFKPHLGVLIPLALVAGDHWKPFGVATITVVGLIAASVFAFGMDPWYGLIGTLDFYSRGFEAGAYSYTDLATVQGMFYLAGADPRAAWRAQVFSALFSVAVVFWAWRHKWAHSAHLGLQSAVLCAATLLTVPMAYGYDLVLLTPAAAWIWADMRERSASVAEVSCLAVALAAILPLKPIASAVHFQYGPLISLAMLAVAVSRLHSLRCQPVAVSGGEALPFSSAAS